MQINSPQENAVFIACLERTRLKADLTPQQLAERLGVSEAVVIDWESGKCTMDFAELRQFCIGAGVAVSDFVDELELLLSGIVDPPRTPAAPK